MEWYNPFCDFRKGTLLPIRYIFKMSIKKNCLVWLRKRAENSLQSFYFQKNTDKLIYFWKLKKYLFFSIINNCQNRILKIIKSRTFFWPPKWAEMFLTWSKKFFWEFLLFFILKNQRRHSVLSKKKTSLRGNFGTTCQVPIFSQKSLHPSRYSNNPYLGLKSQPIACCC